MYGKLGMTTISSLFGVSEVRLTSHPDRYPVGPSFFFVMLVPKPIASYTLAKSPTTKLYPVPGTIACVESTRNDQKTTRNFHLS